MLPALRAAALLALGLTLLSSCGGGGGGGGGGSGGGGGGGGVIPSVTSPVTINITGPTGTQSASISVSGGTPTVIACPVTCSTTLTVAIGTQTFTVSVFSGAGGSGTQLSTGSVTQLIAQGQTNVVNLNLGGASVTISSITVTNSAGAAFGSFTLGTPGSIALTIAAKDSSGNTILGTYATPIHLLNLDNDTAVGGTNSTTLNTTTVTSSSTAVTLTYNGSLSFPGSRVRASLNTNANQSPLGSFLVVGPCSLLAGVSRFGYYPCDLQSAYNLASSSASGGSGQTVALVDAYDDPSAEADLQVYRNAFSLPTCTTANGCFKKISQTGSTTALPPTDPSACTSMDGCWEDEEALDLDMASAICPNCKILLVEANSPSLNNLGTAENTAASQGATEISNSWGASEDPSIVTAETTFFLHPNIPITVSTGDNGFAAGVSFPASSQYVTAVGGTTLTAAANTRGWTESAWSGAVSGCSQFITKPAWQTPPAMPASFPTDCLHRMIADVAADADVNTPVWIYTTYQNSGWRAFGGTSASAPMIAGVYAISGNASTVAFGSFPYSHTGSLNDVTSGSNGPCSGSPSYFCTAAMGYDGPTGLGTPKGVSAFVITQSLRPEPIELTSQNYHPGPSKRVCNETPRPGYATCFAMERTDY